MFRSKRLVRGRVFVNTYPHYNFVKSESRVVPGQGTTIKELFSRHCRGGDISVNEYQDIGGDVEDFSQMTPLDKLEHDLTDIDTISAYMQDLQKRQEKVQSHINSLKRKQNENRKDPKSTDGQPTE